MEQLQLELCWNITERCNQTCAYCHRFYGMGDLTYYQASQVLNNIIDSGSSNITWTGRGSIIISKC